MKTRFLNAKILPLDHRMPLFSGELVVEGSAVAFLGEDGSSFGPFDREIDCRGNLLLPGFKTRIRTPP